MLKRIRATVAVLMLAVMVFFFLDFAEILPLDVHWLFHIQMTPALLGGEFALLGLWMLITLLFGRVYCSAVCPLGILQDVISRLGRTVRGKRGKFEYAAPLTKTRLLFLAFFLVGLLSFVYTAVPLLVAFLDPYSIFGRIVTHLALPLRLYGNNALADALGPNHGVYLMPIHTDMIAVTVSLLMLAVLVLFSFFYGRHYCNTICPVGTFLGLLSRFSYFRIRLKHDCISCGLCEKACKGECIDSKAKTVDASRCVACFNCLGTCRRGSIVYSIPLKPAAEVQPQPIESIGESRRGFLHLSIFTFFLPAIGISSGAARNAPPPDPSLPTGVSRVSYPTPKPILPPGAGNRAEFQRKCTACHLCVSRCPADIIVPSTGELGLTGFLQPVMRYDFGFCNYNCTICGDVCPTRALEKLEKEGKHLVRFGKVVFLKENCVVNTQQTSCGACAEHCPTSAIKMVPFGDPAKALTIPEIDAELCVGCGACEHICPVRPYRAIYIDGLEVQEQAKPAYDPNAKQETIEVDDFGF